MPFFAIHENGPTREFQSYDEAEAFVWGEVKAGHRWSIELDKPAAPAKPTAADYREAGRRVAEGILAAMGPDRSGGYHMPAAEGPGIGSFERAQIGLSGAAGIILQDRRDTFARCLAAFDVSIARIGASYDILQFMTAAE